MVVQHRQPSEKKGIHVEVSALSCNEILSSARRVKGYAATLDQASSSCVNTGEYLQNERSQKIIMCRRAKEEIWGRRANEGLKGKLVDSLAP